MTRGREFLVGRCLVVLIATGCAQIAGLNEDYYEGAGDPGPIAGRDSGASGSGQHGGSPSTDDNSGGQAEGHSGEGASGEPVRVCEPDRSYCDGARLVRCRADGSGPVDSGEECASVDACLEGVASGVGACPGDACVDGQSTCMGGETATFSAKCSRARTHFEPATYCSDTDGERQCNPASGQCFQLRMDATEVTQAEYAAFLLSGAAASEQGCAWNENLEPDARCMEDAFVCQEERDGDCGDHPQVCVDWCDAKAYCEAQGKHLCGRIGGGMNPFDRAGDAGSSEWMNGCSAGGQFEFGPGVRVPSGPQHCNYEGTQLGTTHAVGARRNCVSPSPSYRYFDVSGNVAEWEDSCERPWDSDEAGANDACRTRGGSFTSPVAALACRAVPAIPLRRRDVSPDVGFRCCGG